MGVILPDTKTSQRWATDDPKFLKQAFDAAGVPVDIRNAEGDKARFVSIADDMITNGVKVLMIVNLDSPSGRAVLAKARSAGIKTIDYDRLTLNGGADYYVSFDNEQVGVLQGQGLVRCLTQKGYVNPVVAELNGSPTDNNATDFKAGYDSILQPKYDAAKYTKGPDQSVPDWVNEEGGVIFAQMLSQQPRIRGVLAANDGLGGAVIKVLKKHGTERQGPGHRPGRHRGGPAEHPHRRPVHDGLQGDQAGGGERRQAGDRAVPRVRRRRGTWCRRRTSSPAPTSARSC